MRDVSLSSDLNNPSVVPYFLWDDPMSVTELRNRLAHADATERFRILGKIMREARDTEVWLFTTPEEVARNWDSIRPYLGRRRRFWKFLLGQWRHEGLIDKQ